MTHLEALSLGCSFSTVLAHPKRLIREGIAGILHRAGFTLLMQTSTVQELRQMIIQPPPDLILLDWDLQDGGPDTIQALADKFPGSAIVVLMPPRTTIVLRAILEAGARGCLSMELSAEEFGESLGMIAKGNIIISRQVARRLARGSASGDEYQHCFRSLSNREREIFSLLADGLTNREIARTLVITENTVKVHVRNILDKLEVRNRQQLVAFAAREGLLKNSETLPGPPDNDRLNGGHFVQLPMPEKENQYRPSRPQPQEAGMI